MTDLASRRSRTLLARAALPVVLVAGIFAPLSAAFAQDSTAPAETTNAPAQPTPDTVVATVGGETITEADLSFAAEDLGQELANIPPSERRAFLVTVLIDMKVMAKAGRDAGLDQTEIFKQRQRYLEDRALRRAYFSDMIAATVTEQSVRAAYDAFVATLQPEEELRARHILVSTEDEALAVKAALEGGKAFEVAAMEVSLDPGGAQNGGDLGYFTRGMMVKPFEDAAFALTEPGQLSEPVQSQFGWHIIKLEDRRVASPPTFEEVAPQLQQQVLFEKFEQMVGGLKAGVVIDIPDPALAAAVAQQSQPAEEAEAAE